MADHILVNDCKLWNNNKKNPSPAELLFAKLMIILSQCSSL